MYRITVFLPQPTDVRQPKIEHWGFLKDQKSLESQY